MNRKKSRSKQESSEQIQQSSEIQAALSENDYSTKRETPPAFDGGENLSENNNSVMEQGAETLKEELLPSANIEKDDSSMEIDSSGLKKPGTKCLPEEGIIEVSETKQVGGEQQPGVVLKKTSRSVLAGGVSGAIAAACVVLFLTPVILKLRFLPLDYLGETQLKPVDYDKLSERIKILEEIKPVGEDHFRNELNRLNELNHKISEFETKIAELPLQSISTKTNDEAKGISADQIHAFEERFKVFNDQNVSLEEKIRLLEEQIRSFEERSKSLEEKIILNQDVAFLDEKLKPLQEQVLSLTERFKSIEEQFQKTEESLSGLNTKLIDDTEQNQNSVLLILGERLEKRFMGHEPFHDMMEPLKNIGLTEEEWNLLNSFSEKGLPFGTELEAELIQSIRIVDSREQKKLLESGKWGNKAQGVLGMFITSVPRENTNGAGQNQNSLFLLRSALQHENYGQALQLWEEMPELYKQESKGFFEKLERVHQVQNIAKRIVRDATHNVRLTKP